MRILLLSTSTFVLCLLAITRVIASGHKVKLWVSETCPYAARAWISCNECIKNRADVQYELQVVDLQVEIHS